MPETEQAKAPPAEKTDEQKAQEAAAEAQKEAAATRVNHQCFLIDNWRTYATIKPGGFGKNLTCIDGPPTDLLQRLTSKGGNEAFMKMTTAEFAQLVPAIRLFTVGMDQDMMEVENSEKEIKFKTFYDESSIESLTKTGRTDSVGLKELSYELRQGGSMETSGTRQKVTLTFTAENLEALRKKSANGSSVLDLVLRSSKFKSAVDKDGASIPGSKQPNTDWTAAKLVYGWAVPPDTGLVSADVRKAVRNSTTTLTLNLTNHSLSFNEDGSVQIEAEYEGYADARVSENSRNILYSGEAGSKVSSPAKQAAEKAKFEANEKVAAAKAADAAAKAQEKKDNPSGKTAVTESGNDKKEKTKSEQDLENAQQTKKDVMAAEEEKVQGDRQQRHMRILNTLNKSGKLWAIDIDPEAIGTRESRAVNPEVYGKMTEEAKGAYDKKQASKAKEATPDSSAPTPKSVGSSQSLDNAQGAIKKHSDAKVAETQAKAGDDKDETKEAKQETKDTLDNHSLNNTGETSPEANKIRITYMYWGDIFNIVLDAAYGGKSLPVKYLVGPITFPDPRTLKTQTVNIADIPIAMTLFSSWWLAKIVAPGKDIYTIKNFVRDSVNELIVAALGDDCFEGATNFGHVGTKGGHLEPPRLEFTVISAALGQKNKDRLAGKPRISDFEADVIETPPTADATKPGKQVEYFYIYCDTWSRHKLDGNPEKDRKSGIYHVAIGQDSGPVKKINFEKDDALNLATHAAMQSRGIQQLVASYKTSISMIGNTIFIPGNYLYVSPHALGVGVELAQSMGLGGYYTVTNVNGKVDASGWTTDMSCYPQNIHGGNRKPGQKKNVIPESVPVDASKQGANPTPGGADPEKKH